MRENWKRKISHSKQSAGHKHFSKNIWRTINTEASIWHDNMRNGTVPHTFTSVFSWSFTPRKLSACILQQMMFTNKYRCIFLHQMEDIVYIFQFVCAISWKALWFHMLLCRPFTKNWWIWLFLTGLSSLGAYRWAKISWWSFPLFSRP